MWRNAEMPLPEDLFNMTVYPAGASAVVAALCDVLRIPEIIDAVVPWDPAQCQLSPGLRVKDMRPDLKQFLVGLTVTKDGLPLLAQLLDGNKSDKTWYPEVLDQLADRLNEEELQKTVFVADAAFPTRENLERVAAKGLCFISRLPEVFGLAEGNLGTRYRKTRSPNLSMISLILNPASSRCFLSFHPGEYETNGTIASFYLLGYPIEPSSNSTSTNPSLKEGKKETINYTRLAADIFQKQPANVSLVLGRGHADPGLDIDKLL
jgi:hypothetical protein